jgi:hypothetical protein
VKGCGIQNKELRMTIVQNESPYAKTSIGNVRLTDTVKAQMMPGVSAPTTLIVITERENIQTTEQRNELHAQHGEAVKQAQTLLNSIYGEG